MWWMMIPAAMQAGSQMFGAQQNIRMSKLSADIAGYAGAYQTAVRQVQEARLEQNYERTISAQRAAAAASGIRTDTGAPMDLAAETEVLFEIDKKLLRSAGSIDSLRTQLQQRSFEAEGYSSASGHYGQAAGSLLESAMWYGNRQGWFTPKTATQE